MKKVTKSIPIKMLEKIEPTFKRLCAWGENRTSGIFLCRKSKKIEAVMESKKNSRSKKKPAVERIKLKKELRDENKSCIEQTKSVPPREASTAMCGTLFFDTEENTLGTKFSLPIAKSALESIKVVNQSPPAVEARTGISIR